MRRKDREITDIEELKDIVNRADVCRVAFFGDNFPYIVTMNFGYKWEEQLILYFHCAKKGKKLDLMNQNNKVCFEMDINHELVQSQKGACYWGMKYKSIVGFGVLESVKDNIERIEGLNLLMEHYGFNGKAEYDETLKSVAILKLKVIELSGKKRN